MHVRGFGQRCEFNLTECQDGQDQEGPKSEEEAYFNIMFRSNKYGTEHPN